ncbi:P-loop containing nucleoside triphosphate hydrolase protein [Hypoxylon crocopeplum]|nr:P-loop containing nucleoside triphosphate hydrolase protein [Hypoxylon crocopeplum]
MDDPWDWDVDRVVREFCSVDRSWEPPSIPLKFPPPEKLEPLLRQHEVNGHTLVTYDHAELCSGLDINILSHRATFKHAIDTFRSRSQRYRIHMKRDSSKFEIQDDKDPVLQDHEQQGSQSIPDSMRTNPNKQTDRHLIRPLGGLALSSPSNVDGKPLPGLASISLSNSPSTHPTRESSISGLAAQKKRRVAPVLISTHVDSSVTRNIPTEADVILKPGVDWDLPWSYLGKGAVTRVDIIHGDHSAEQGDPRRGHQFEFFGSGRGPYGRQLQIHQLLRRQMLRSGETWRPYATKPDMVPGANDPDHNEVLPLYGDSDGGYDTETWDEIVAEQSEQADTERQHFLNHDEIQEAINAAIQRFVSSWKERKLPKLMRKANRTWIDARRSGLKKSIDKNRNVLKRCESRITKYRKEITMQNWRCLAELEETVSVLQQSVEDREYFSWVLGIITNLTEPENRFPLPLPRRSVTRAPRAKIVSAEEEVLTTDSETELDGFIVDDEPPSPAGDDHVPPINAGTDDDIAMDDDNSDMNEQVADRYRADEMGRKNAHVIDLTQSDEDIDMGNCNTATGSRQDPYVLAGTLVEPTASNGYRRVRRNSGSPPSSLTSGLADLRPIEQVIARELDRLDGEDLKLFVMVAKDAPLDQLWMRVAYQLSYGKFPKYPHNTKNKKNTVVTYTLLRMFEMHRDGVPYLLSRYKKLTKQERMTLKGGRMQGTVDKFGDFARFLNNLLNRFELRTPESNDLSLQLAEEHELEMTNDATSKSVDSNITEDEDRVESQPLPKRKHKSQKKMERERQKESAKILREENRDRVEQQERRRKHLRAQLQELAASGIMDIGSQRNMIINESKENDQGIICVHPEIATRIKEHQVAGVRFVWDEIVTSSTKQGCLLAHTMGLGKTMQVITFLVAITDAAGSKDPTVSSQVPEDLRNPKILILCPASLADNWMDELLYWTPEGHRLGEFFKVDSSSSMYQRQSNIQSWDACGGVLIISYHLFEALASSGDCVKALCDSPDLVVADEAHLMKNSKSKTHVAAASVRTHRRIALTGSPMANNVEEYHTMVNWVAPNYLSDIKEFREEYVSPITKGLKAGSNTRAYLVALKMLRVLKEVVEPKVQRITIAVLKHDIPAKQEFILTVPLTELQWTAYETYASYLQNHRSFALASVEAISALCAHPSIFLETLQDPKERIHVTEDLVNREMTVLHQVRDLSADILSWKIVLLKAILIECKRLGDSVLIFSQSLRTLDYIDQFLRRGRFSFKRLDGKTNVGKRQPMVKEFNKGQTDVFLISTKAGGLGLNITGANRVVIFDARFNPQEEQQAVGRAYRLGQKKPVVVYRFVCGGTAEEQIQNLAVWKLQLTSRVVDKKNPIPKASNFGQSIEMPTKPVQKSLDEHIGKDAVLDKVIEQHGSGIRAITLMDTFEEEDMEHATLSAEDQAEAIRLVAMNEARRLGKRIPPLETSPVNSASANQRTSNDSHIANTPDEYVPHQPTHPQPVQLPARPVRRHKARADSASALLSGQHSWGDQPTFTAELTRRFLKDATSQDEEEAGRRTAQAIAVAVWNRRQPESHGLVSSEIIDSASSPRFVEAMYMGLLSPAELADMTPSGIKAQRISWQNLSREEFEGRPSEAEVDPHHLMNALRKMSSTPKREDSRYGQHKPHRIDDQEALEAVAERRKAKQSSHGKDPRLPSWAIDAVARQGRIAAPLPPASTASSTSSSRPLPRTPFK